MKVIAVSNQKGGVGKTTVSMCLGAALARAGHRTLVVDLDPQASATYALAGEDFDPREYSLADVMMESDSSLDSIITATTWGFDIAPTRRQLSQYELQNSAGAEHRLRELLEEMTTPYDVVLIDCPPALGKLTLCGLTAADEYLLVTEPTFLALRGLVDLLDSVALVTKRLNKTLVRAGVIVNRVERTNEHDACIGDLHTYFPDELLQPFIPKRTALQEAIAQGKPLGQLAASRGAGLESKFDRLAEGVMNRVHA
jgi:chromosome partitioning protein